MALAYPDPELADRLCLLRRWSEDDLACIAEAGRDRDIVEGTTVPRECSDQAGLSFVRRQWRRAKRGEGLSLAIADAGSDEALGLVWLPMRPQPGVLGMGYWVIERARRRGLASSAVALLSSWALEQPGVARVEAWVTPGNRASRAVLESAGFELEGVLRSFLTAGDGRADAMVFSRVD